jgi:hypothetical protein
MRHAVINRTFGNGLADGDARIERTIGILENDLDALAVRLQQPARQVGDFVPGKADAAGGRMQRATVDLPEPLSPTMPRVRPLRRVSVTSWAAATSRTRPKKERSR